MKYTSLFATLFSLSVVLVSCGDPVELKLNLAQNDTFSCTVKMDQKVTTSAMGMNMNIDQNIEMYQTLHVDDAAGDGTFTFTNTTDRFYMKQSMPMMGMPINVEYDTDKPEKAGAMGEAMGPYFEKMKGLAYQVTMDSRGNVLKSNIEEVYERLGLDSLSKKGGSNGVSNNADQYLSPLPEKPVRKGDSYTVESKVSGEIPMSSKNTYTVKEITADKVTMEVKSEFLPGSSENSEYQVDVKGSQTGTVEIDRHTGMTLHSEITQDLKMTLSTNGMSVPMTSKGTIVFDCKKK